MPTKNWVPRANGEGGIGTEALKWGSVHAVNGNIDNYDSAINTLQTKVTTLEHAYAGAKAATTVADMTDHEQIYVYVGSESGYTNGNWYYWNGTAWTSGGVYNATALETDKTLTVSGAAADAKVTGDEINIVKTSLSNIKSTIKNDVLLSVDDVITETINGVTTTTGYMDKNGNTDSNPTYMYTSKIAVTEGQILKALLGTTTRGIRFVCAFNGDSVVADKGSNIESGSYIVPAGITHVVLTCYSSTEMTFVREITNTTIDIRNNKSYWALQTKADSLSANTNIFIENGNVLYNKKNCSYSFTAKFSTFTKLTIAHGKSYFGTSYIEIDNTNIKAYEGKGDTLVGTFEHGLTISDFISVLIKVNNEAIPKATIVLTTANGQFIQDDVLFTGSYGDIYANSNTALTDVVLAYSMADLKKDIMIFGDSYISLNDSGKWPYYMMDKGYKDYMLCGYSGATSQAVLESFLKLIYIKRPKYIVWLLGMNNNDVNGTYNGQWKNALDNVLSVCEEIGCIPILATIPNTPTVTNVYKNLVVKNSGYRYIDFAKAVNAESEGSSWYPNMLSSDNVHPTALGARVLAMRVLIDFPEIMVAE